MEQVVVVRGGHLLTMGPAGDLEDGAVAFAAGEVLAVGPFAEVAARFPGAEVVGDGHGVVLPGLVNAHTHLSEALLPDMGEDLTLLEWLAAIIAPASRHLTREMARVGAMLKGAELLLSGATCVNDMFCPTNLGAEATLGVVDGLEELGLRGVVAFGPEVMAERDRHPVAAFLAEHEALAGRCADTELVGFRLGVGTVLGQTDELLAASARAAREHSWAVHTHLAEVREEVVSSRLRWGRTSVERAADVGLLEVPVVAGHGIWVSEPEIRLLAGVGVAIVHNPVANMLLGSGVCPLAALRGAGIPGRDRHRRARLQRQPEHARGGQGGRPAPQGGPARPAGRHDRRRPGHGDHRGARALGLDGRIGSLEPGKRADVVRLRGDRPGQANVHDPRQQVVYCASGPTWPTSGSTAPAAWPTGGWSATTWPPWPRGQPAPGRRPRGQGGAGGPLPPGLRVSPGSVAPQGPAGQGAAAGLGQQHVVGGDDHELAAGQRAGDLAPDRPAGGVPVGRPELLQGRLFGGVEAVVGGWPWSGWAGRRALARSEPEGSCTAQPPERTPEKTGGVAPGICHWGPPDSVLAGPGTDFLVPD